MYHFSLTSIEEYYRKDSDDSEGEEGERGIETKKKKKGKKEKKRDDSEEGNENVANTHQKVEKGAEKSAPSTAHLEEILSNKINASLKQMEARLDEDRIRVKDKNDRATVD